MIRHFLSPIFPYHCVTGIVSRTDKHVAGWNEEGVESGESDRAVGQRNRRRFASRGVEEHGGGGKWRGRRDSRRHTLVPISPVIYVKIFRTASLILLLHRLPPRSAPKTFVPASPLPFEPFPPPSSPRPHLHLPQQQRDGNDERDSQVFPLTRVLWPFRPNLTARRGP